MSTFHGLILRFDFVLQPAVKLLEFFRQFSKANEVLSKCAGMGVESGGLPVFAVGKALAISRTLKNLQPIGRQDIDRWIRYWGGRGMLD